MRENLLLIPRTRIKLTHREHVEVLSYEITLLILTLMIRIPLTPSKGVRGANACKIEQLLKRINNQDIFE